jgi:hypothetical protein
VVIREAVEIGLAAGPGRSLLKFGGAGLKVFTISFLRRSLSWSCGDASVLIIGRKSGRWRGGSCVALLA